MDRIFIVEDDTNISSLIARHLSSWGYECRTAENFENIISEFIAFDPKLVLLDISLPFFNGYHWCTEIRKLSKLPIIFISSASDNMNMVMAMNMGGDDFVAKPFDLSVLTAKIQAMLRRSYDFSSGGNLIECHGVVLNISELSLGYNGSKIELSKNESKIMEILMNNAGKCVTRENLMTMLWENEAFVDDNTLNVNINRIRKRLDAIGLENSVITKKGVGYMFVRGDAQ